MVMLCQSRDDGGNVSTCSLSSSGPSSSLSAAATSHAACEAITAADAASPCGASSFVHVFESCLRSLGQVEAVRMTLKELAKLPSANWTVPVDELLPLLTSDQNNRHVPFAPFADLIPHFELIPSISALGNFSLGVWSNRSVRDVEMVRPSPLPSLQPL